MPPPNNALVLSFFYNYIIGNENINSDWFGIFIEKFNGIFEGLTGRTVSDLIPI